MNYALCKGKCEKLNPFVLHNLVKKYAGIIGDYAFVNVVNNREQGTINICVKESDSGKYSKPISMSNSTWESDFDEIEIVMIKIDDTMNFIEKHDMDEIMESYRYGKIEVEDI